MRAALKGILHGRTIELDQEPDLPDGLEVTVEITPILANHGRPDRNPPWWLEHFEVNPGVALGKLILTGTQLHAESLVTLLEEGLTEAELILKYPQLTPTAITALREYAKVPSGLRRSLGSWAEDAKELDDYLEWNRQRRKLGRRETEP